jgi:hypothetical protein
VCVCVRVHLCSRCALWYWTSSVHLTVTGWDSDGMVFGPQVRKFFADPETVKIFNSFVSSGPSTAYGGADSPEDDCLQARGTGYNCRLLSTCSLRLMRFVACPLESSTSYHQLINPTDHINCPSNLSSEHRLRDWPTSVS